MLVESDGTPRRPYCTWDRDCRWDAQVQLLCALSLCKASGFGDAAFVNGSDMCTTTVATPYWANVVLPQPGRLSQEQYTHASPDVVANCSDSLPSPPASPPAIPPCPSCFGHGWSLWGLCCSESTRRAEQTAIFGCVMWLLAMQICLSMTAVRPATQPLGTLAIILLCTAVYTPGLLLATEHNQLPIISPDNCVLGEYNFLESVSVHHDGLEEYEGLDIQVPLGGRVLSVALNGTPAWILLFGIGCLLINRHGLRRRIAAVEGELPARLADGQGHAASTTIRLLSVRWLLAQPTDYVLRRRQELPDEAFVEPEEARRLLQSGRVGALSYRWLTAAHPDPDRFHLSAVLLSLRPDPSRDGCWPWLWLSDGRRALRVEALFWDYASLPQAARTAAEQTIFENGLRVMANFYAHPRVVVLQQKHLPASFDPSQPTYEQSGWCTFEAACAHLAAEEGGNVYEVGRGWVHLRASARRSPKQMASIFADPRPTKWRGVGRDRPTSGSEIVNERLAAALREKQEFTDAEVAHLLSRANATSFDAPATVACSRCAAAGTHRPLTADESSYGLHLCHPCYDRLPHEQRPSGELKADSFIRLGEVYFVQAGDEPQVRFQGRAVRSEVASMYAAFHKKVTEYDAQRIPFLVGFAEKNWRALSPSHDVQESAGDEKGMLTSRVRGQAHRTRFRRVLVLSMLVGWPLITFLSIFPRACAGPQAAAAAAFTTFCLWAAALLLPSRTVRGQLERVLAVAFAVACAAIGRRGSRSIVHQRLLVSDAPSCAGGAHGSRDSSEPKAEVEVQV